MREGSRTIRALFRTENLAFVFFFVFIAYAWACIIPTLLGYEVPYLVSIGDYFLMALLYATFHIQATMGFKHYAVFAATSMSIGFLAELLGTSTGLVFGSYTYLNQMGPRLLGLVPPAIMLGWFLILYLAFHTTNLIVSGLGEEEVTGWLGQMHRRGVLFVLLLAGVDGIQGVVYDLIKDPIAVNIDRGWRWEPRGSYGGLFQNTYYNIPVSNFIGWFFVGAAISTLFRAFTAYVPRPEGRRTPSFRTAHGRGFEAFRGLILRISPPVVLFSFLAKEASVAVYHGLWQVALIGILGALPFLMVPLALELRRCGTVRRRIPPAA